MGAQVRFGVLEIGKPINRKSTTCLTSSEGCIFGYAEVLKVEIN
jgi:hypothetical protein